MMLKFEAVEKQSASSLYNRHIEIWRAIYSDDCICPVDQLLLKDDAIGSVPGLAGFIIGALIAKPEGAMNKRKTKVGPKQALGSELQRVLEKTAKASTEKYQSLCYEGFDQVDWVTADENFQLIRRKRLG